jgi:SAM-dependent methyltransferase
MSTALKVGAIQDRIRGTYGEVAQSATGKFRYAAGREGALALGYDASTIAPLDDEVLDVFCGVGNPFALSAIHPGETVLDVGCGGGVDLIIASRLVGATGAVRGIDLTPAMVDRARANLTHVGVTNAEVQIGSAEAIPCPDRTFDLVTSNGVLNLSPTKDKAFSEIYRVLKPGGRLQFADIVLSNKLPAEVANNLDAWAG